MIFYKSTYLVYMLNISSIKYLSMLPLPPTYTLGLPKFGLMIAHLDFPNILLIQRWQMPTLCLLLLSSSLSFTKDKLIFFITRDSITLLLESSCNSQVFLKAAFPRDTFRVDKQVESNLSSLVCPSLPDGQYIV